MEKYISILLGFSILVGLCWPKHHRREEFKDDIESNLSIFLNLQTLPYKNRDYSLMNTIQQLRYQYTKPPSQSIFTQQGWGQVGIGALGLRPVILIPGLGIGEVWAKWNRQNTLPLTTLDALGQYQLDEKWKCKDYQDQWTKIWYPDWDRDTTLTKQCWIDNTRVYFDPKQGKVSNQDGVRTMVPQFGSSLWAQRGYMTDLYRILTAIGYQDGSTLFGAQWDLRLIASQLDEYTRNLSQLIERAYQLNGKKVVIIGHSLGANIANYFLVNVSEGWKKTYIDSFISISGAFGGCPKALRYVLSGGNGLPSDLIANFSGLQWMLPNPKIYKHIPLVHFKESSFTASDIPYLMDRANLGDASSIYNKIILPLQEYTLKPPKVPVYVLAGEDLMTESSFHFQDSLENKPDTMYPYTLQSLPYQDQFNFPREWDGDGTLPRFVSEIPLGWTKQQKEPIIFRFYKNAEHTGILSMGDPVRDIVSILLNPGILN